MVHTVGELRSIAWKEDSQETEIVKRAYKNIIYALQELDTFRHGKLQKCLTCVDMKDDVKYERESIVR